MRQGYKFDESGLFEWEIFDVNLAVVFVEGGKLPLDEAAKVEGRFCRQVHFKFMLCTVDNVCEVS